MALTRIGVLIAYLLTFTLGAGADEPAMPPSLRTFESPHGKIRVLSDPTKGTDVIEVATGKLLWHMAGWFENLYVLDDGEHLASVWGGFNLIPLDAPDSFTMIWFWEHGRETRSVSLSEIVPDRSILIRTVSHYAWGNFAGIDERDRLVVVPNDKKAILFSMADGQKISGDDVPKLPN